jgi:PHD/YefM family antitoxin component YafN of YafNO toxin-antitoxin module
VESTYSVTEAQAKLPTLLRELPVYSPVALTRHDRTVAFLVSKDQMEGIIETMEILANPDSMRAIRDYEAGRMKFVSLEDALAAIDKSLEADS